MGNGVRQPAVAGSFYPGTKEELARMLREFFQKTKKVFPSPEKIKALVTPHAGYIYSGQTAAWGYRQLPETISAVLIGPAHFVPFAGLAVDGHRVWQTPLGKVNHKAISDESLGVIVDDQPHQPEHSLEVQLPFLQFLKVKTINSYLTGQTVDHKQAAEFFLKKFAHELLIFSSDLSHYLPDEEAREKDKKTIEAIIKKDSRYLISEENAACGRDGLLILIELAKKNHWQGKLVYYDTSVTAAGDRSAVVGYSSVIFYEV